jgi:hypothetical protein
MSRVRVPTAAPVGRRRLPGALAAGLVVAGCGLLPAAPRPAAVRAPTPAVTAFPAVTASPAAAWTESLTFSGDLQGTMVGVVSGDPHLESECTGPASLRAGTWASTLYGQVGSGVYEVVVVVPNYRGPGTYRTPQVEVQVARPDGSAVWATGQGQPASFGVDVGQRSGTLDATLIDLATGQVGLHVTGTWSCGG